MKISLAWLKDWLTLSESPQKIADVLTLAGLEVDKVDTTSFSFEGVIIAKVLKAERHPDAERLQIAQVFDGEVEHQVVCAASNCRPGLITAFAKIGSVLRDEKNAPFTIKKCKLRGVESSGMLCAADELGLALESSGIMELPHDAPIGTLLSDYLTDTIFEISLTPNLGHCTSILGIARELSAHLNRPLSLPEFAIKESSQNFPFKTEIENYAQCPRYMTRVLQNIEVGPSPSWLVKRLEACGMRSINNVVDVTNYVMLELGQPLHAFDGDKLPQKNLRVSLSSEKFLFKTLDGLEREIPSGILLISSGDTPVALAGLMGGEESAVTETTTTIVLEAAVFDSSTLRRSMKTLGFRSESAGRFEKGVDPNMVPFALDRAAFLLQEIAGAEVLKEVHDNKKGAFDERVITLRTSRINQILGTKLSAGEIPPLLKRLFFDVAEKEAGTFFVSVPTFRNDIKEEIDLIEEVARLYGYHNIEKSAPKVTISSLPHSPLFLFEQKIRTQLTRQGLQEFLTCDLISPKQAQLGLEKGLSQNSLIEVLYPSSVDQSILRATLLPGHLQAIKHNLDYKTSEIAAFEIGAVHFKTKEGFEEPHVLGITLCGPFTPPHFSQPSRACDFFDIKGLLENLLVSLNLSHASFTPSALKSFHPQIQAKIEIEGAAIGVVGQVHPSITSQFDIHFPVYFAEIELNELMAYTQKNQMMQPLPLFPSSERDWTLSLKKRTPYEAIKEAISSLTSPYIKETKLIAIYEDPSLGPDRKNVTLRFTYRNDEATIDANLVNEEHQKLIESVTHKLANWMCN